MKRSVLTRAALVAGITAFSLSATATENVSTSATHKVCYYKLTAAHSDSTAPLWETKTVRSWQNCPPSWTIAGPGGWAPGGVYIYQYYTFR
ncbi:hypothetical protein [Pseudoalteromonas luteoviolacea]|uniref:Uncharacterized protein n=1 Tax=Pseudoalteromonas luteoviolacea NCIMB 1942 TaxID=1365253 RepID=A0A167H7Q2_9GAMM|nr:hypothetical protein [Pseudoalteromonas luteoviolacea]KZN57726.1 hypothetical protein N482_04300 [Pseudoalteromonas luteoviolacea NCIMB 1942]KZW99902.1 hypothetical protein JL49_14845 [Pseudoalteromonas luteoviolacea]